MGRAKRHVWLPRGLTAKIDTYGDLAPRPAANRLYVPYERSERVRAIIIRAFLLHAGQLWKAHEGSGTWTRWYESFLTRCLSSVLAFLRKDLEIRRLFTEFRDASSNMRGKEFYCSLGALHSKFGRIVLTKDLDGQSPYLDLLQPIPLEHIQAAAAKAGVDADKINRVVDSLSEFLGWDITKGYGQ